MSDKPFYRDSKFLMVVMSVVLIVLYSINPSETPLIPCLLYTTTGWQCAGCGMTRATHQLFHGRFELAWNFNPLVFVIVPVASYLVLGFILREWFDKRLPTIQMPLWAYIALGIAVIAFTIARNMMR